MFPVPYINQLLDCLADARYFASIDVNQTYHQAGLAENARAMTAFNTKQWQYNFKISLNVPSHIQEADAWTTQWDVVRKSSSAFGGPFRLRKNWDRAEWKAEAAFWKIRQLGLNPWKCSFHNKELIFLEHTISPGEDQTNSTKTESLTQAVIPNYSFVPPNIIVDSSRITLELQCHFMLNIGMRWRC